MDEELEELEREMERAQELRTTLQAKKVSGCPATPLPLCHFSLSFISLLLYFLSILGDHDLESISLYDPQAALEIERDQVESRMIRHH